MMSYIGHRKEFLRLTFLWTGAFLSLFCCILKETALKYELGTIEKHKSSDD